ncbi:MAG: hypothetical protein QOD71_599 [Thermoleophilaceae bacterium]|jgi:hypothetical protein|nr:hypothetical protein [Thermoleophilaceae bacterium]
MPRCTGAAGSPRRLLPAGERALKSAWRAFWISRVLVWSAGVVGVLVSGAHAYREVQPGARDPSESLSALLLSPARRWDSGWYLGIAQSGYDGPQPRTAFFPLYPLLTRIVGEPIDALGLAGLHSLEIAGVLVSLAALIVALYLLHRLTDLEMGADAADNTVLLVALFPMSFFFSAIYSESLFLALTVGCVYFARRGWWWRAGALGALASATRSQGLLVLVPLAIIALYGPRADREPVSAPRLSWRPRYRPSLPEVSALLLVPLGLLAYLGYLRATTSYGALTPFKSQEYWLREFRGPLIGVWGGFKNGVIGAHAILTGGPVNEPVSPVRSELLNFTALAFAAVGTLGALRRLPIAYGAYAVAALIFSISFPANQLMLKSLPRLVVVIFPIFMWAGLAMRPWGHRNAVLAVSAVALACASAAFASGYWIA